MTPFTWMFLQSYELLRTLLLDSNTFQSLIQPEYHAFFESAFVPICTFVVQRGHISDYEASFISLEKFTGAEIQSIKALEAINNTSCGWFFKAKPDEFKGIPGNPIAFTTTSELRLAYEKNESLEKSTQIKLGISPGDSARFLRLWQEVSWERVELKFDGIGNTRSKWYPTNKGGGFRRWYGNIAHVMNWESNGDEIRNLKDSTGRQVSRPQNLSFQFKEHSAWTRITPSHISFRKYDQGFLFTDSAVAIFSTEDQHFKLGLLNTVIMRVAAQQLNPTLNYQPGDIAKLPIIKGSDFLRRKVNKNVERAIQITRSDWDAFERSWDFKKHPMLNYIAGSTASTEKCFYSFIQDTKQSVLEMKQIEEENNSLFLEAYGLRGELQPEVPIEQITLTGNTFFRYGAKLADIESQDRLRRDTVQELISYAIGCMMGRYSLDEPGLIYAHAGNVGFEPGRYATFPADADGIVPITDELWFADDACSRIREFLRAVWGPDTLEENIAWLAESLGTKATETPDEAIRRYIADKFFKDHLQIYKKRPIYWLFSSGKQGAFLALVYLHRYHEGTLARMRAEYVVPLTGKIQSRIDMLEKDAAAASSTAARNKLNKEIEGLRKKHVELLSYDERLRHYADMRIKLDLDDGVKVNYGKFGDLLAEVKAVTGGASDD